MKAKRNLFVSLITIAFLLCCSTLFVACSNGDKHVHNYAESVVTPTCTENGYTIYQCTCGDWYIADTVDARGHHYGDLIAAKSATCTEGGHDAYYHCEECDTYFDATKIATTWAQLQTNTLGHNYGTLISNPATCTQNGYADYYHCETCNTYFDKNKNATTLADLAVNALGHDYGTLISNPATCTQNGYADYYHCETCNTYFDKNKNATTLADLAVNALGHDYGDKVDAVPVTCTSDGNNAYYHCKACDSYFDENKNATTWDKIALQSNGHDFGDGLVHNPATCMQSGYDDYYYCSVCKTYFDAEKVPTTLYDLEQDAIEHRNNDYFEAKAATCIEEGNAEYLYCPDCKNYLDIDGNVITWSNVAIAKIDHAYGNLVHNPATCTKDGYNDYYQCSVCKTYFDSAKAETTLTALAVSATGHHYTDTVVAATCSATGYTNHVCACGYNYKDATTEKLDHNCNDLDICSLCNKKIFELTYTLSTDETYYVVGGIKHGKTATTFEIPAEYSGKPVKEIGASAFEGNTKLTNVTIPESVTTIGANAFKDCTSLVVNIGAQLTSIGDYAFSATAITSVAIPDGITIINEGVFYNCTKLASVTFHSKGITQIGSYSFYNTSITNLPKLGSLQKIGAYAFANCSELKSVMISSKVTTISTGAFKNSGITGELKISNNDMTISAGAFRDCINLVKVHIKCKTIGSNAFNGCSNLQEVIMTGTKTASISASVFEKCNSLKSISIPFVGRTSSATGNHQKLVYIFGDKIPDSLESVRVYNSSSITSNSFSGCTMLKTITIKKGTIGNSAFANLTGLENLILLDDVTEIGNAILKGCTSIKNLTVPFVEEPGGVQNCFAHWFSGSDFENSEIDENLYYKVEQGSGTFIIPKSLTKVTVTSGTIPEKAFTGFTGLTAIGVGEGVTKIEKQAFYKTNISTIYLSGNSLSSIDRQAFYNRDISAIYADTLENWLTTPAAYSLMNLSADLYINGVLLQGEVVIPGSVKEITGSFKDNSNITSVVVENGVEKIGASAFYGCTGLTSVTLPNSVKTIDGNAFYGCENITSLNIPTNIECIGGYAFYGLSKVSITTLEFNNSLKEINSYAFAGWTNLTQVTIPDSVTNGSQYVFEGCTNLETITCPAVIFKYSDLPASVKYLTVTSGELTGLTNYPSLITLTVGDNVTAIGDNVGTDACGELKTVTIGSGVATWAQKSFTGCVKLESITISADNANFKSVNNVVYSKDGTKLYVYARAQATTDFTIPSTVTDICEYAVHGASKLKKITIPSSCTVIGPYAFSNCSDLETVVFNEGLETIANYAFENCSSIKSLTIPRSVTGIGIKAFSACSNLETIALNEGLLTISDQAFENCSSLTSLTLPNSVTSIGEMAFAYCSGIQGTITMSENLTSIGEFAFAHCSSITEAILNEKLTDTNTGHHMFDSCTSLTTIKYYNFLYEDMYSNCDNLVNKIKLQKS